MEHKTIQSIFSLEDNEAAEVKRLNQLIADDINVHIKDSRMPRNGATNVSPFDSRCNALLNMSSKLDWSLLMYETFYGYADAVQILLDNKANTNLIVDLDCWTALMVAACKGRAVIADKLIKKDARVNTTTRNGETSLMFAAEFGHIDVIEILLGADADVSMKDNDGKNALDYAETLEIADLLKQHISKS